MGLEPTTAWTTTATTGYLYGEGARIHWALCA
jgi:hypothetical protein